jgi:hypothetical protein
MRPTAEAELGSLPDLDKVRQVVDKELQGLNAPVGTEVTCIGWLRKDPSGAWQCLTKANCPESGYLVIVRFADSQKGAARLEQIGSLDKFKAIVKAASGPALAEGRPVFACPTAKQRTARP